MYQRALKLPLEQPESLFLFGPRGTGKTQWIQSYLEGCVYINLLKFSTYQTLNRNPEKLSEFIPESFEGWVVIDEVQRVPELLNEVHHQIESEGRKFLLTGSSARRLREKGVNLLAGRALKFHMHPMIIQELGDDFTLARALQFGLLPKAQSIQNPKKYLETYVQTYIREEVFQESLVRNTAAFSRFVEVASFSQGEMLNVSNVAREVGIDRQVVSTYFDILEDLLIAIKLPAFTRRAQRKVRTHPKFYYFDVGVYRSIRPTGYLDTPEEAEGAALETLFLQSARAVNDYYELNYEMYFWRSATDQEVDFVLYGQKGFLGFEIKRSSRVNNKMLKGLKAFGKDYPEATLYLAYTGTEKLYINSITVLPIVELLKILPGLLSGSLTSGK